MDTFVMLEELLEQDQFELLPSKECDTERRLVYLMNDAVESFLVFRGAALTGHYLEDYEGALTWSISRDATRYVLVVRQGDNAVTLLFEKLDLDLKIAQSGSATFRVLVQTKDSGDFYYYGDPVVLVDASGSVSAAKVDMKLLMKLKNQLNLDLTYTAATTETREQPATAPAAGETVVNPYEGLYGGDDVLPFPEPAA